LILINVMKPRFAVDKSISKCFLSLTVGSSA
jgi:hypothetical protein